MAVTWADARLSLFAILAVFMASPAMARQQKDAAERVFAEVSPSIVVVSVENTQATPVAQGSGVVIAPGQVVTNCHVTRAGPRLLVYSGKKALPASVRYADDGHDLCQLAVPGLSAPAVAMGAVKSLSVGQSVYAVGAPEGLELTISQGIISALRPVDGSLIIQTTASISPGSSGGGLFDAHGRLVGITAYQMKAGQNLNFALPADWIAGIARRSHSEEGATASRSSGELKWLRSAAALEQKHNWQRLLRISLSGKKRFPNDILAWDYFLGMAYDGLGQYKKEIGAYKQTVQLIPWFEHVWGSLGLAYAKLGQYDQAVAAYKQAIRLKPKDEFIWLSLGLAYDGLGQYKNEIPAYKQAIQLKPEDEQAWYSLGLAYAKLGQYDQAVAAYKQAIRLEPEAEYTWCNLAAAYYSLGQYDYAVAAAKEAIQLKPEDEHAWYNLGTAYDGLGQYKNEIPAYKQAIQLKPEDEQAWYSLGLSYAKLGQNDQTVATLRRAIRLKPEDAQAWTLLGMAYVRLGQNGKAVAAEKQAIRLKPEDEQVWYSLGLVYCFEGDRDSAIKVYEKLQKLNSRLAGKLFNGCIVP